MQAYHEGSIKIKNKKGKKEKIKQSNGYRYKPEMNFLKLPSKLCPGDVSKLPCSKPEKKMHFQA